MKQFLILIATALFMLILPSITVAQPAPPPPPGVYHVIERCYTMLFPYPHSRCEYIRVRRNYTPAPPPPHRMGPPPMGPRPGHHPPPPPGGHWHPGHGHHR